MLDVAVVSAGRFHGFDLARQVYRLGHLSCLYTGYPVWKVDGLPRSKVASFPFIVAPMMLLNKRGLSRIGSRLNWMATESFDRWVARSLRPCDVFHFLSSLGMRSQRVAHSVGAVTICDRGSTHVLHQDFILAEEFERWGIEYRPFDRRIVERELVEYEEADAIFVPSSFVFKTFVDRGIAPAKLVKIPYGVDTRMFRPATKEDDVFRVIYVGIMNLRKGIPYLLEAIAPLKLPRFELWLVGPVSDDARPFLSRYEGCYRMVGYVSRHELYRYYSQASVFVLASVEEGLATVIAQAMACGIPVIATANTGAEDLITNGVEGFIVPVRDVESIRERVLYLYTEPDVARSMGRAALRRVELLGGWDKYGEAVVECYLRLVKNRCLSSACRAMTEE